jgi:type IV secretory pathway protease TraF
VLRIGHTGTLPRGTAAFAPEAPVKSVETARGGALVSLLAKGRNRFLAIVNRDFQAGVPLVVELNGSRSVSELQKDGTTRAIVSAQDARELAPGDIVVLTWEEPL